MDVRIKVEVCHRWKTLVGSNEARKLMQPLLVLQKGQ